MRESPDHRRGPQKLHPVRFHWHLPLYQPKLARMKVLLILALLQALNLVVFLLINRKTALTLGCYFPDLEAVESRADCRQT